MTLSAINNDHYYLFVSNYNFATIGLPRQQHIKFGTMMLVFAAKDAKKKKLQGHIAKYAQYVFLLQAENKCFAFATSNQHTTNRPTGNAKPGQGTILEVQTFFLFLEQFFLKTYPGGCGLAHPGGHNLKAPDGPGVTFASSESHLQFLDSWCECLPRGHRFKFFQTTATNFATTLACMLVATNNNNKLCHNSLACMLVAQTKKKKNSNKTLPPLLPQ